MPWGEQDGFSESVKEKNFRGPKAIYKWMLQPREKMFAFLHCKLSPPSLEGRRKGVLNSILASKYTNKEKQRIKDGWMNGWMD